MISLKINSARQSIIYKLGPRQSFRRILVFHPVHNRSKYILRRLEWYTRGRRITSLAEDPSSRAGIAMEHARDAEESVPVLQIVISLCHPIPEPLRVEACDLIVLTAMVTDDFSTFSFEGW